MPARLSDSQAKEAVEAFLTAIKGTTDFHARQDLGAWPAIDAGPLQAA